MATSQSRREVIRQGALAGAGLGAVLFGGTGCSEIRQSFQKATGPNPAKWEPALANGTELALANHVLNRAGFGQRPGEANRLIAMGAGGWLEEQLADKLPEDPAVAWRVNSLDIQEIEHDDPDELYVHDDGQLVRETEQAAILRATYSAHQVREMMADFWTNHFNLYVLKGENRSLLPVDTEQVLRPHLLGSFEEMLTASAHSPAMLTYLDNRENRNGVANENYAREILELHTLGVNSGYSQKDIQEVARCFTGWTVGSGFKRSQFEYNPSFHDDGEKYIPFLQLRIRPNGGQKDADAVLRAIANHPITARFLAKKICWRVLGDAPPEIVDKAAKAYLKPGRDTPIRALLRPILLDGLLSLALCKPIVKRPLDLAVSALRALAADTDGGEAVQKHLADMGQPLYQWPMPDGFPEKASAWTSVLLPRWKFALALASNGMPGTKIDLVPLFKALKADSLALKLKALGQAVLGKSIDASELSELKGQLQAHIRKAQADSVAEQTLTAELAALMIASPQFQGK